MIAFSQDFSSKTPQKNQLVVQNSNKGLRLTASDRTDSEFSTLGSETKTQAKTPQNDSQPLQAMQFRRKHNYALRSTASKILPNDRVCKCGFNMIDGKKGVAVKHNGEKGDKGKAKFTGVVSCDSVWVCPVCALKIMARRGRQVAAGIETWANDHDGHAVMLTTTHSHKKTDILSPMLQKMKKARSYFWGHRSLKIVMKQVGYVGHIKALEYTHGNDNGAHPHHHDAVFIGMSQEELKDHKIAIDFDKKGFVRYVSDFRENQLINKKMHEFRKKLPSIKKPIEPESYKSYDDFMKKECGVSYENLETFVKHFWIKSCSHAGLGAPSLERGATIQGADDLKSYLTKMSTGASVGMGQELTNTRAKSSKRGGRSQWDLLNDAHRGCFNSAALFREYAIAFKGERQLFWSPKLKNLLGIRSDKEEAKERKALEAENGISIIFAQIAPSIWQQIKRYRAQSFILTAVENDVRNGTNEFETLIEKMGIYDRARVDKEQKAHLEKIKNHIEFRKKYTGEVSIA